MRVPHRFLGRDGTVAGNIETDGRRQLGPELRHQRFNPRHGFDDIRIGLPVDLNLNHRIAIDQADVSYVLIRVDNAAEIRQADRRTVAVNDDEILIIFRQEKLVGRINRNLDLGVSERAFRFICIRTLKEGADLIQPYVVAR